MVSTPLPELWSRAGFAPNDAQRQAIEHVHGPLYLPAGPGSGKTRVLLWRTLNLLVFHGVSPEEIYLSTFTEKAAKQLKEGLQAYLGTVTSISGRACDFPPLHSGTVHISQVGQMLNGRQSRRNVTERSYDNQSIRR